MKDTHKTMRPASVQKLQTSPVSLSSRAEDILRAIYTYRYMTALDLCHLLYSPKSLTHVREILRNLSGGRDEVEREWLYRFPIPTRTKGTKIRALYL